MSADSRRARGLLATAIAHPLLKLTAVGLAVMLWWFVDNRITRTLRRTIPLTTVGAPSVVGEQLERLAVVLPTDRVVGRRFFDGTKPIDGVEVVLSGPRFRVSAVEDNQILDLQVTKFLSLDWNTRTDIEFDAGDIRRDRALEQLRIELVRRACAWRSNSSRSASSRCRSSRWSCRKARSPIACAARPSSSRRTPPSCSGRRMRSRT